MLDTFQILSGPFAGLTYELDLNAVEDTVVINFNGELRPYTYSVDKVNKTLTYIPS